MSQPSRRRLLQLGGVWLGVGLAGCSGSDAAPTASGTHDRTGAATTPSETTGDRRGTATGTPVEPTPSGSLPLEVINTTDDPIGVDVRLTESTGDGTPTPDGAVYAEAVELGPSDRLDLRPYRNATPLEFAVAVDGTTLFEDTVEPYEGHTVRLLSETDVHVDTVAV